MCACVFLANDHLKRYNAKAFSYPHSSQLNQSTAKNTKTRFELKYYYVWRSMSELNEIK